MNKKTADATLKSGVVFAFDGPDGIGKTTQVHLAADKLQRQGYKVEVRRIMGGTPIGEALRKIAFSDLPRPIETEMHIILAIYTALAEETEKLRKEGCIVLIDRSPLSIVAYQAYGGGLPIERGYELCDYSLKLFKPDMLTVYKADEDLLNKRRAVRHPDENDNHFENQAQSFHSRTIKGYSAAAARYQATVIDAAGTIEEIHQKTMQLIANKLQEFTA